MEKPELIQALDKLVNKFYDGLKFYLETEYISNPNFKIEYEELKGKDYGYKAVYIDNYNRKVEMRIIFYFDEGYKISERNS